MLWKKLVQFGKGSKMIDFKTSSSIIAKSSPNEGLIFGKKASLDVDLYLEDAVRIDSLNWLLELVIGGGWGMGWVVVGSECRLVVVVVGGRGEGWVYAVGGGG
ncbi:hypothetical protein POM88_015541 [Heracleum sosnowskyi]|uniref:Uncharacterized protein n=1 Tax=Heracleum sosnowskyi TaxID=360622 RepID=A0AAD8MXI3_9APIA|nr:hypothetical protein POM88_015541 [Heracleum sosnowskyi]